MVLKYMVLNDRFDSDDKVTSYRVLSYIDSVLINYCPYCGKKIEIEVIE